MFAGPPRISPRAARKVGQRLISDSPIIEMEMDVTTVPCGSATRDRLAEFRDTNGHPNYDAALQDMLEQVDVE